MLSFLFHIGTYLTEFFDILLFVAGAVLVVASYASGVAGLVGGPAAALLAGPVGKVVRYAGLALMLTGGCRFYVTKKIAEHDAQSAALVAKEQADFIRRATDSASAQAKAQTAREQSTAKFKAAIANDPAANTCRDDPAFDAAASELRRRAGQKPATR